MHMSAVRKSEVRACVHVQAGKQIVCVETFRLNLRAVFAAPV